MLTTIFGTSILAAYIGLETQSLIVERLIINDPELPENFHNLRVVFITDVHHGTFSREKRVARMVKKINALNPDLVLMGGDNLQTYKTSLRNKQKHLGELCQIYQDLQPAPLGNFTVPGNHDYDYDEAIIEKKMAAVNIKTLKNTGLTLTRDNQSIYLAGVDDLWHGRPQLAKTLAKRPPNTPFTLLISHQPNYVDQITPEDHINFVLAGHTHGTQVSLFGLNPFIPRKVARYAYRAGLIDLPQTRMLVSSGIGNVARSFRCFAPPKLIC